MTRVLARLCLVAALLLASVAPRMGLAQATDMLPGAAADLANQITGPVSDAPASADTGSAAAQADTPAPDAASGTALQAATGIDYTAWETVAQRAEEALASGRASNAAFDTLRTQLDDWRKQFEAGQKVNEAQIETVQSQIDALGPKPAEGDAPEAEAVAKRRAALQAQLSDLNAPRRTASEAFTRANALIGRIDTLMRERQANAFLQLGPSPLNPANWPATLAAISRTTTLTLEELRSSWRSSVAQTSFRQNLPAVIFFVAIAALLLVPVRRWVDRMGDRLRARAQGHTTAMGIASFFTSLGQLAIPIFGTLALAGAFQATSMMGLRSQIVVSGAVGIALGYFIARWIASRIFPKISSEADPLVPLTPLQSAEARINASLLGVLIGVLSVLRDFNSLESYEAAIHAVATFPVTVLGGVLLFRLGNILARAGRKVAGSDVNNVTIRDTILLAVGRLSMLVGVIAPVIAAVGYQSASEGILWPAVTTLGLLGLLVILSRLTTAVYAILARKSEEELQNALVPVLLSFALVILAIPVAALIWGMRVDGLREAWTRIKAGINIGDVNISPTNFLTFALVFAIGYVITRLFQQALSSTVLPKTKLDIGGRNAVRVGVGYVGIFLSALAAITVAGIDLSSLAIVAGALSVGIGFGLQTIVSNFVSGIILLIERPISEGDWIEVGGQMGFVRDISVRSTRIETFDRTDVIVPNADLISGQVTNYTRGNSIGRLILPVGVAYGTDTRKVEAILRDIAHAHPMVSLNPEPQIFFMGLGASSLDFEIRCILPDVLMKFVVQTEMLHQIVARFAEEGIEVPFAQHDLWLRNPEALGKAFGHRVRAQPAGDSTPPSPPQSGAQPRLPDSDGSDNGNDGGNDDGNDGGGEE